MNTIRLKWTPNGWRARWQGPHSERVKWLFGTDTLPIAFTSEAAPETVLQEVAKLNPDTVVLLG